MKLSDLTGYRKYLLDELDSLPEGTIFNNIKRGRCWLGKTIICNDLMDRSIVPFLEIARTGEQFFGSSLIGLLSFPMIVIACPKNCKEGDYESVYEAG
jgi:hypothetical protein